MLHPAPKSLIGPMLTSPVWINVTAIRAVWTLEEVGILTIRIKLRLCLNPW